MQGALAHRVLGLLWELTFAPGAPAEVAQSPVLSDSLHHYAGMGSEGIDMVWDYITRCISQVGMLDLSPTYAGHGHMRHWHCLGTPSCAASARWTLSKGTHAMHCTRSIYIK